MQEHWRLAQSSIEHYIGLARLWSLLCNVASCLVHLFVTELQKKGFLFVSSGASGPEITRFLGSPGA